MATGFVRVAAIDTCVVPLRKDLFSRIVKTTFMPQLHWLGEEPLERVRAFSQRKTALASLMAARF